MLNLSLAIFNLLPIPPLDGSHLLRHATGMSEELYSTISRHSWIVMLVLINIPQVRDCFCWLIETALIPFEWVAHTFARLF